MLKILITSNFTCTTNRSIRISDIIGYLQVPQQHSTVHQYPNLSSVSVDTALPAVEDIYTAHIH